MGDVLMHMNMLERCRFSMNNDYTLVENLPILWIRRTREPTYSFEGSGDAQDVQESGAA